MTVYYFKARVMYLHKNKLSVVLTSTVNRIQTNPFLCRLIVSDI